MPNHLKESRHSDWIWPLSYVPRKWTSFCLGGPPKQLFGNLGIDQYENGIPPPVPKNREGFWWSIQSVPLWKGGFPVPAYFSFLFRPKRKSKGIHFRIGARWDSVDYYYTFPEIALVRWPRGG